MIPTPEFLAKRKAAITADLLLKLEVEDYHGVADCAMDLREVVAQLDVVRYHREIESMKAALQI